MLKVHAFLKFRSVSGAATARTQDQIKVVSTAFLLLFCLSASPARANVAGSDLQNFNPTSDGLDFVTVQSVRTLPPGVLAVGGFLDFAQNPLPYALDSKLNKFRVSSQQTSTDVHFGLGLNSWWDIGVSASGLASGSVSDDLLKNYFISQGLTDVRANTKFHLVGTRSNGLSLNFTLNYPWLDNDPFYGNNRATMGEVELLLETVSGRWLWAANAGFRFRNAGATIANTPYEPVGNQMLLSGAGAYRWYKSKWSTIGELYASRPVSGTTHFTASDLASAEVLLGLKYWGFQQIAVHGGLAAGILRGIASPDYRAYIGMNWYPGHLWGGGAKKEERPSPRPLPPPVDDTDSTIADLAISAEPAPTPYTEPTPYTPLPTPMATPAPTPLPAPVQPMSETAPVTTSNAKDTSVFNRAPRAKIERFVVRQINFDSGSDVVPPTFYNYLEKMSEYLKKDPPLKRLTIYGHTDSQGPAVYNQDLSQRRAEAVKRLFSDRFGIAADKIEAVGYGLSSPAATNATAAGRSLNRRVEMQVERE